jgi:hypothetical protein
MYQSWWQQMMLDVALVYLVVYLSAAALYGLWRHAGRRAGHKQALPKQQQVQQQQQQQQVVSDDGANSVAAEIVLRAAVASGSPKKTL